MSNIFRAIFPRPVPKARLSDVQEPRSVVSAKAVDDFTRAGEEAGIFDQTRRLQKAMDSGDVAGMEEALRETK